MNLSAQDRIYLDLFKYLFPMNQQYQRDGRLHLKIDPCQMCPDGACFAFVIQD